MESDDIWDNKPLDATPNTMMKDLNPALNLRTRMEQTLPGELLRALRKLGRAGDRLDFGVYAVGGFVRDLVLRRKTLDIDVAVEGRDGAVRLAREFSRQTGIGLQIYPRFQTATLLLPGGSRIDLATTRVEHYPRPAALPEIRPGTLAQDLSRRDFSINTLALNLHPRRLGVLIDHFGALSDIHQRKITVLHPASFVDDPTRIFRALRLEQRLEFRLSRDTSKLLQAALWADMFSRLSGSRLLAEIKYCLSLDQVAPLLSRMSNLHVLPAIHPSLRWTREAFRAIKGTQAGLAWFQHMRLPERYPDFEPWIALFLTLTSPLRSDELESFIRRLQVDRQTREKILRSTLSAPILKRLGTARRIPPSSIYRLLSPLSPEVLISAGARSRSETARKRIRRYLSRLIFVEIGIDGTDLKKLGLPPGPVYREILDRLHAQKLDGRLRSRKTALDWVKKKYHND